MLKDPNIKTSWFSEKYNGAIFNILMKVLITYKIKLVDLFFQNKTCFEE